MSRISILVVEDDEDVREVVAHVLDQHGYRVRTACNGLEAMRLLRGGGGHPRLVLLDLMMPIMSGWEVLEEMAADPTLKAIPVVAMTAATSPERGGHATHWAGLLPKPVTMSELLDAVDRYLDGD